MEQQLLSLTPAAPPAVYARDIEKVTKCDCNHNKSAAPAYILSCKPSSETWQSPETSVIPLYNNQTVVVTPCIHHRFKELRVASHNHPSVHRSRYRMTALALTALLIATFHSGCYFTTQSYNYGKLLNPGEGQWTVGFGGIRTESRIVDKTTKDSIGNSKSIYYPRNWMTMAVDYRLGFLDTKPFGGGLEIGVHVEQGATLLREIDTNTVFYGETWDPQTQPGVQEIDTSFDALFWGPPAVELAVRVGLPQRPLGLSTYYQNIDAGWIVGAWVDNGWFVGYSGGAEFRRLYPYGGVRLTLAPTNIFQDDVLDFDSETFFSTSHPLLSLRTTLGCALKLRPLRFLPDMIIPEIVIIGPNFDRRHEVGVSGHIGFRWINGL
jgi:hypothetical protein